MCLLGKVDMYIITIKLNLSAQIMDRPINAILISNTCRTCQKGGPAGVQKTEEKKGCGARGRASFYGRGCGVRPLPRLTQITDKELCSTNGSLSP